MSDSRDEIEYDKLEGQRGYKGGGWIFDLMMLIGLTIWVWVTFIGF